MKGKRAKSAQYNDPPTGSGSKKWEPVPIEEDMFLNKEFENLISFEVLNDYTVLKKGSGSKEEEDAEIAERGVKRKLNETKNEKAEKKTKLNVGTSGNAVSKKASKSQAGGVDQEETDVAWGAGSSTPWTVTEVSSQEDENEIETEAAPSSDPELEKSAKPAQPAKSGKSAKNQIKTKPEKGKRANKFAAVQEEASNEGEEYIFDKEVAYKDMMEWVKMGLSDPILQALHEMGFQNPTPIQQKTLPSAILGRKDIVGAAETGSGKTLAFGIPMLEGILKDKEESGYESNLKALVLTPTRELAVQVKDHIQAVAKHTDIQVVVIVGGLAAQKQERLLRMKPEIVIATPGRLWELVQEGNKHLAALGDIKFLAVDETDRMVEKGHFQELTGILSAVNSDPENSERRQNFIFSATLAFTHEPPQRLQRMTGKSGKFKQPAKKVDKKEKLRQIMELVGVKENAKVVDITERRGTCESLTERQITCPLASKDYYLYYFFTRHPGRTIVFCNSINCVRRLTNLFFLLKCDPVALHSDMAQKQRLRSLERFTENDKGILIATDVAARGLDIVDIQHVIHYQVPKTAESYIHRSGRTARAFKGGIAILIAEPAEHTLVSNIMRSLDRDEALQAFDVDGQIFREMKARVDMAVKVESFEHSVRKRSADMNWMDKAKKEMDLASSEEDSESDEEYQRGEKGVKKNLEKAKKELETCKQKLSQMLSVNLFLSKPTTDVRSTFQKLSAIKKKI